MGFGETLVALGSVFALFVLPVAAWMFSRMLKHRERMAMYRSGYVAQDYTASRVPPPPPAMPHAARSNDFRQAAPPEVTLRKGVGLAMIGLALTIGLSFIRFDGTFHPGPWLLGGLIPLFVGLSNVILALLAGATLGPRPYGSPPNYPPSPEGMPGPAPDPASYNGSYTYRPGDRTELTPPAPPPERR